MKKRPTDPTKIIDEAQVYLFETRLELKAFSTLFSSLGTTSISSEDLRGLSFLCERLIKVIDETNQSLNEIYKTL